MTTPTAIGRYQILQSVGRGGMGTLYLAKDPKIGNRLVVLKLLREGLDDPELRERFAREADAAGGLRHVNVVTIFDVGDFAGQPFIAMDYIKGETLTDLIGRRARLPLGRKLQLMEELCAGLHYAHRKGVVHRDIKPANIMVDEDGVLKILDFGIARLGSSGMTQAGMVMGTLNYMAPQQMAGEPVDARADMFSAGAVFYELLSYRRAFPGELPGIVHKILTASREPLETLVPDIGPELLAIVNRCLEKDPGDRYADMAAVRKDLSVVRQRVVSEEQIEQLRLEECLTEARAELERGALTAASMAVERALAVDSTSPDAVAVRDAIDETRRRLQEAQARAQAFAAALARARSELDAGSLESALDAVDAALEVDAEHGDARAVRDRVLSELEARRKAEEARRNAEQEARRRAELEARARAVVEEARRQFATGSHNAALKMLEDFFPAHPNVASALSDLRVEVQEIERRRLETERRRREEARRQEEDKRRQEEERRKLEQEARRKQEEERQRQEARRRRDEDQRRQAEEAAAKQAAADATVWIDPAARNSDRSVRVTTPSADRTVITPPPVPSKVIPDQTIGLGPTPVAPAPTRTLVLEKGHVADAPHAVTRDAAVAPRPVTRRTAMLATAAVAVLSIIGTIMWAAKSRTTEPPPAAVMTAVVFDIAPWAKIDAITSKDGRRVGGNDLVTPCVVELPPGDYHVRASNPNFSTLEFDVTIALRATQEVRAPMPGFDPQTEVTKIVDK